MEKRRNEKMTTMGGKRKRITVIALVMIVCLLATGCQSRTKDSNTKKVTLITMDQMDVYWVSMDEGVKAAISELEKDGSKYEYNWYAPDTKDNAKQIEQIDMAASNQSDVILIAVNDPSACNAALEAAAEGGTKIIYVDSAATFKGAATFSTNNFTAGIEAGKKMLETLGNAGITEGVIGIVSAQIGVESCTNRIEGFCKALEGTGFTTSEVQYSDGDTTKAQELSTNLINNGAIALFGVTGQASVGCGNAAKDAKDKVYCIGFDSSEAVCSLVENGSIEAVIVQNPYAMGYEGMKAAAEILGGKDYAGKVTDTGINVVTKANVKDYK